MNFKDTKEYIKNIRKIDGHKFSKVADITNMIDLLNEEVEMETKEDFNKEVSEISKFLLRTLTTKTFILGKK